MVVSNDYQDIIVCDANTTLEVWKYNPNTSAYVLIEEMSLVGKFIDDLDLSKDKSRLILTDQATEIIIYGGCSVSYCWKCTSGSNTVC